MMRTSRSILPMLAACIGVTAPAAWAGEKLRFRTPDELRAACRPLFRRPSGPRIPKAPDDHDDSQFLFVVRYLSSSDREMQDAAVEILAQLARFGKDGRIRASVFDEYLAPEHSVGVQTVALAFSVRGFVAEGESAPRQTAKRLEKYRDRWTRVLNTLAEQATAPPHFDVLATGMMLSHCQQELADSIRPANKPLTVERCLHSLSMASSARQREQMVHLLGYFPLDMVVRAALEWYPLEPDRRARWEFISRVPILAHGGQPGMLKLHPVLRLAAKDWDPKIAAKAKRLLGQ